jgi:hypothetical protein
MFMMLGVKPAVAAAAVYIRLRVILTCRRVPCSSPDAQSVSMSINIATGYRFMRAVGTVDSLLRMFSITAI